MITETLNLITSHTPKWMRQAQCADADPTLFFPEPGEENSPRVDEAKRICKRCPVQVQCLRWGYKTNDKFAILGGLTARQRWAIARRVTRSKRIAARIKESAGQALPGSSVPAPR